MNITDIMDIVDARYPGSRAEIPWNRRAGRPTRRGSCPDPALETIVRAIHAEYVEAEDDATKLFRAQVAVEKAINGMDKVRFALWAARNSLEQNEGKVRT